MEEMESVANELATDEDEVGPTVVELAPVVKLVVKLEVEVGAMAGAKVVGVICS